MQHLTKTDFEIERHMEQIQTPTVIPATVPNMVTQRMSSLTFLLAKRRKSPIEYWRAVKVSKKLIKQARIAEFLTNVDQRPHISLNINGVEITGLLDSGATISCFGKNAFDNVNKCELKWKDQSIKGFADVRINYKGQAKLIRFYLIPSLANTLYLGIDF